jgi:hypothetical protein
VILCCGLFTYSPIKTNDLGSIKKPRNTCDRFFQIEKTASFRPSDFSKVLDESPTQDGALWTLKPLASRFNFCSFLHIL